MQVVGHAKKTKLKITKRIGVIVKRNIIFLLNSVSPIYGDDSLGVTPIGSGSMSSLPPVLFGELCLGQFLIFSIQCKIDVIYSVYFRLNRSAKGIRSLL